MINTHVAILYVAIYTKLPIYNAIATLLLVDSTSVVLASYIVLLKPLLIAL